MLCETHLRALNDLGRQAVPGRPGASKFRDMVVGYVVGKALDQGVAWVAEHWDKLTEVMDTVSRTVMLSDTEDNWMRQVDQLVWRIEQGKTPTA